MPLMTTVASGRCTSAPAPVAIAIGKKPNAATAPVVSTARIVCDRAVGRSPRRAATPAVDASLHVARHDDAVEHRDAGERDEADRGRDAERQARDRRAPSMPPMSANGTTAKTASA